MIEDPNFINHLKTFMLLSFCKSNYIDKNTNIFQERSVHSLTEYIALRLYIKQFYCSDGVLIYVAKVM